jgi:dihydroorotate dehydrogenase
LRALAGQALAQHTTHDTMLSETIAALDHRYARPLVAGLSPQLATSVYSSGRNAFLAVLTAEKPDAVSHSEQCVRTLWGLRFRCGLMNAAGMFKNGEGYLTTLRQSAGGYLAGTTTAYARAGNIKNGIRKPFAPYPHSRAASNWLGLPNLGHAEVARRMAAFVHQEHFPIGASLMTAPESKDMQAVDELVEGMKLYDEAGVHFLEINESCPNVSHGASTLEAITERLEYVSGMFLKRRQRSVPVIVKFSTDTAIADVEPLLDVLLTLGFDGVNFGNTSTNYARHRMAVAAQDHRLYDYFTTTFGGGVSGEPLRQSSLALVQAASAHLAQKPPQHEFHVIRTGGIRSGQDVEVSFAAGASLCQWYTGYFECFAESGHSLYETIFSEPKGITRRAYNDESEH